MIAAGAEIELYSFLKNKLCAPHSFLFAYNDIIHWGWGEHLGIELVRGTGYLRTESEMLIRQLQASLSEKIVVYRDDNGKWIGKMSVSDPFEWLSAITVVINSFSQLTSPLVGFVGSTAYQYIFSECNDLESSSFGRIAPDLYFILPLIEVKYDKKTGDFCTSNHSCISVKELEEIINFFHNKREVNASNGKTHSQNMDWNFISKGIFITPSDEDYEKAVLDIKVELSRQNLQKVVLARQATGQYEGDPAKLFQLLRTYSPTQYEFLFETPNFDLVGCSPEMLVEIKGGAVNLSVLAGTELRGKNEKEDHMLEVKMLEDPKQVVEHLTTFIGAVQLMNRVCISGSVTVNKVLEVKKLAHIQHLGSEIRGCCLSRPIVSIWSSFLPTLSGTPSVDAYRTLLGFESFSRGVYGGVFGYFDPSQALFCKIIRSIYLEQGRFYVHAGAGITADSQPEDELRETKNKMWSCLCALK